MHSSLPLLSTIIPAYNHQDFIAEALHSLLAQEYPHLEIILIDDGSEDATPDLAERILARGGRPYRLFRQENQGAHAAINRGIELASGEYLAILNSDDRFQPARLSTLINALQSSGSRFAFSKVQHIDQDGQPHAYQSQYLAQLEEAAHFPSISFALLRHNLAATTSNFLFHRSLLDQVGFFSPYITCHDWDFLLRVMLVEEPLFVDQILLDYRIHPQGTLQVNLDLVDDEVDQVLCKYLDHLEDAVNDNAPGPRQWGAFWDVFASAYLQHLRSYPGVSSRLDSMSGRDITVTQPQKCKKMQAFLAQHSDLLTQLMQENEALRQQFQAEERQKPARRSLWRRIAARLRSFGARE